MYSMKEACEMLEMPYETLKYYCNEGLVPNLKRDENNYRRFDERNIAWLGGVQCLRKAGMGVKEIKQYMVYCLEGKKSIPERQEMLDETKKILLAQVAELQESLDYLEQKQELYKGMWEGTIPYKSSIIPE